MVNTSGSGKTRLLYEGLCQNWGFYFTSIRDPNGLGCSDLQVCIDGDLPASQQFTKDLPPRETLAYDAILLSNIKFVRRRFSHVLLARLLVFRLFIDVVHELHGHLTEDHKKFWLMLQLCSFLGDSDICTLLSSYFQHGTDSYVDETISDTLDAIHSAWDRVSESPLHLFFAVDEANSSSQKFTDAFSDEHGSHSILVEILRTWRGRMPSNIQTTFIVAGTQIPRQDFLHDDWKTYRWTSDTGAFDTRESQREYILRYLPKTFAESPSGEALISSAWDWCRGRFEVSCCTLSDSDLEFFNTLIRHRFTVVFLNYLLFEGFQVPHKLLRRLVHVFAGYWISIDDKFEEIGDDRAGPGFAPLESSFRPLDKSVFLPCPRTRCD